MVTGCICQSACMGELLKEGGGGWLRQQQPFSSLGEAAEKQICIKNAQRLLTLKHHKCFLLGAGGVQGSAGRPPFLNICNRKKYSKRTMVHSTVVKLKKEQERVVGKPFNEWPPAKYTTTSVARV